MIELIKFVVQTFAENPDKVVYDVIEDGANINVTITLDKHDMGKVIGRHGKIAKAIRSVMKAAAVIADVHVRVDILDQDEMNAEEN
jgi:predicted RNA-binding protein YlqC (UPF0109 family)